MRLHRLCTYLVLFSLLCAGQGAAIGSAQLPSPTGEGTTQASDQGITSSPEDILYFWDFEGTNGGFGATLDWEWGTYSWIGNNCYGTEHLQPSSPHSGTDMWGTVLNNCYNNLGNNQGYATCVNDVPADDSILSFTIDLTDATGPVELSWWEWYDLFMDWDWGEVYANGDVVFQHCGGGYVQPTSWVQQTVDLTPYSGGPVTIEFHMMASTVVNYSGWYIDDVMVTGPLLMEASKQAPATAEFGDVIPYTITLSVSDLLPGTFMTDTLPAGVEYAGNLNWNVGEAWYDAGENAVKWVYNPSPGAAVIDLPATNIQPDPDAVADLVGDFEPAGVPVPEYGIPTFTLPEAVLWDNGPLITHPGGCGGTDASRLQTDLAMNTLGFGNQLSVGNRMADNFEVTDPDGWLIDQITFFSYQTGSPVDPPPITGVYYQIWDGSPDDPASIIVFGDLVTNRLVSSTFTSSERDSGTTLCPNSRYIFANIADAGILLPPGVYWLDWTTDGSASYSGPWAPPVTILGQTTTGDGLQYTTSSGAWGPANDSGTLTQQDLPFLIIGEEWGQPQITFDVTVTAHCCEEIVNEAVAGYGDVTTTFTATTTVDGDAILQLSPSLLDVTLQPDKTDVQTLQICNLGERPLEWELHEMIPTLRVLGTPLVQVTLPEGAPQTFTEYLAAGQPSFTVEPAAPNIPAAAPDSLIFYDDRGDFDTDYPGLPVEGYENGSMVPGTVDSVPHPLDELSSNAYFDPGDILPGIQFWATADNNGQEIAVLGEEYFGNPSKTAVANTFIESYRIVFDPPVQAAGMDLQDFMGSGSCQIDIYGPYSYIASVASACSTAGVFWGVASDEIPIAEIVITSLGAGAEGAENIAYSPMTYPNIPWISEDPVNGTVDWGECQNVAVTFDTTGLAEGEYLANLLLISNDQISQLTTIPVRLTVVSTLYIYLPFVKR